MCSFTGLLKSDAYTDIEEAFNLNSNEGVYLLVACLYNSVFVCV